MAEVKSHQSVDWAEYFYSIRSECPWSWSAWTKGLIDIEVWSRTVDIKPLGHYQARMYLIDYPNNIVEAIAQELDSNDSENEWLFSYPGYGQWATPTGVLIQQNRQLLNTLRSKLE